MVTEEKESKWDIYLRFRGIAKGCRKSAVHMVDIAQSHDDGTDESKPLLGGHDLQTMARKALESARTVSAAELVAVPIVFSTGGMFNCKSFQLFDPRRFGAVVNGIDGKPFKKEK